MNKDADFLAEAYLKVIESAKHCKAAKQGCDCDNCEDCEDNQKVNEAKKGKLDPVGKEDKDINNDGKVDSTDKYLGKRREAIKKSMHKENAEMASAYETILEYRLINKKFARRYNKLTSAMLKAQPGSEEYGKIKTEREDLVSILKDHGMTPRDLEEYLVKKEKENPLPEVPEQNNSVNQYNDNSYSDTADISPDLSNSNIEVNFQKDMAAPQAEVATMPPDQPASPNLGVNS
jgi:hypothetical protein